MSAEEGIIWGKFLASHGKDYDRFDYDLRVGSGISPSGEVPELFQKDYKDLTKKRIDAVGYKNNLATIFEVKQRANFSAIGQLLGYGMLFREDYPTIMIRNLAIVCSFTTPDDYKVISSNKILVFIIP
jgi:hypothetical protein